MRKLKLIKKQFCVILAVSTFLSAAHVDSVYAQDNIIRTEDSYLVYDSIDEADTVLPDEELNEAGIEAVNEAMPVLDGASIEDENITDSSFEISDTFSEEEVSENDQTLEDEEDKTIVSGNEADEETDSEVSEELEDVETEDGDITEEDALSEDIEELSEEETIEDCISEESLEEADILGEDEDMDLPDKNGISNIRVISDIQQDNGTGIAKIDFVSAVTEGKIADATRDFVFTVTANEIPEKVGHDYSEYYDINDVYYTVGDSTVKRSLKSYSSTYAINASNLTGDITIHVKGQRYYTVTISDNSECDNSQGIYSVNRVKISVKANSKELEAEDTVLNDDSELIGYKYKIYENNKVILNISQNSKCELIKASLQMDDEEANDLKINRGKVSVTIDNITNDYSIDINAKTSYAKTLISSTNEGDIDFNSKKTYSVTARNTINLFAYNNDGSEREIDRIEVTGNRPEGSVTVNTDDTQNIKYHSIDINKDAANTSIKLNLYDANQTRAFDTITIKVLPTIAKVTVSNTKAKTIEGIRESVIIQNPGTRISYKINKDKKDSKDILAVSKEKSSYTFYTFDGEEAVGKASIDNDKSLLIIDLLPEADISNETIKIYNRTNDNAEVASIILQTTQPAWTKYAPAVKLLAATDINVTLGLSLPKGVNTEDTATAPYNYFYRIEAIAEPDVEGAIANNVAFVPAYRDKVTLKVLNYSKGSGKAANFTVKTELMMVKGDGVLINPTYNGFTNNEIATSKTYELKRVATKNPAYDTKLTLTQKTTKLYTGQENVIVAVPKFSSATTFTNGVVISSIKNEFDKDVLNSEITAFVDSDNNIVVSACAGGEGDVMKPCAAGKYTVRVKYIRGAGNDPLYANIPITIAQAIDDIKVSAPNKVYMQSGKKLTFNAEAVLNSNPEKSATKPESKKVKWFVITASANLAGTSINASNGTVTVPASCTVSSNPADNCISIYAMADDYKGRSSLYSDIAYVYVTKAKTEIKSLHLLNENTGEIINNNDTISCSDHFAIKAYDDDEKTSYSELSSDLYTVKVTGAFALDEKGYVYATKAGSGTITVTARDGGKSTVKMTVKAVYAVNPLQLMSYNLDDMPTDHDPVKMEAAMYGIISDSPSNGYNATGEYRYNNYRMPNKAIAVAITNVKDLTNVTFSLSGGANVYTLPTGVVFVPTSKVSTVTVTDKNKPLGKNKYVIKFTNYALDSYLPDTVIYNPRQLDKGLRTTENRPSVSFAAINLTPNKEYKVVVSYPFANDEDHPLYKYIGAKKKTSDNSMIIEEIHTVADGGFINVSLYLAEALSRGELYTTNFIGGTYRMSVQLYEKKTVDGKEIYVPASKIKSLILTVD